MRIIDFFEVIDIEKHERQPTSCSPEPLQLFLETLLERCTIGNPRQRIRRSDLEDSFLFFVEMPRFLLRDFGASGGCGAFRFGLKRKSSQFNRGAFAQRRVTGRLADFKRHIRRHTPNVIVDLMQHILKRRLVDAGDSLRFQLGGSELRKMNIIAKEIRQHTRRAHKADGLLGELLRIAPVNASAGADRLADRIRQSPSFQKRLSKACSRHPEHGFLRVAQPQTVRIFCLDHSTIQTRIHAVRGKPTDLRQQPRHKNFIGGARPRGFGEESRCDRRRQR